MFKKTRLRIFALIVGIATLIIALMLSVIYAANAGKSYDRSLSLLESYVENYTNSSRPMSGLVPDRPDMRPEMRNRHDKMYNLSTFYSVFYNQDGQAMKVDYHGGVLYSEQEILDIANSILAKGKERGTYSNMPYLVKATGAGKIVALIDNTFEMDNSDRLLENTMMVGGLTWLVILILAWVFSKKIVDPLEENDNKQKQFISDAGHELKTPISVISANADLLSLEIGENKWLSNIQYENERMGNLVKQLLELVRAENMQQAREYLDFSRLASGGTLPFESVAFENGLILNTEIEDCIYVNGNQNQLGQLISILIDNAIHHGEAGKEVLVKLKSSKHKAVFSVVNAGQPIPDEVKERLFERFYRSDEARTEDVGHYGLGLAIAKAIVTAHGGKIELSCYDGLIEFRAVIPRA